MNGFSTSNDARSPLEPEPGHNATVAPDDADSMLAVTGLDNLLLGVMQSLAACRDGRAIAATLVRSARELIGADGVTVVMREDDRCRYLEEDAIGALWKGSSFPMNQCVSGWCMTMGEPVVIPDIRLDGRIPQPLYAATFVRSMAMTPIGRERPIGALGAYWSTTHHATDDEVRLLWLLADTGALALHNLTLAQQVRRNNVIKDGFLTSLADELSESLGPMRTSLHLRQTSGDLKAQVRANEILEAQLARQARLVRTLVDSSEVLSGRATLRLADVDLRDIVSTLVRARLKDAEAVEVQMTCELPPDEVRVGADAQWLQQALHRILDNSIRCTPAGGRIDVALAASRGWASLVVRDTGIGIDPAALPHVFEPFFKPVREPARSVSGLGLGLSFVARVVELHGGSVGIDSKGCGRGAVVEIRLPALASAAPPPEKGDAHH